MKDRSSSLRNAYLEVGLWFLLAAGMWVYARQFDRSIGEGLFSAVAWPRAIFILIGVFAVANLADQLWRTQEAEQIDAEDDVSLPLKKRLAIIGTLIMPLIYAWFVPRVGFFIMTPFFVGAYMYLFRERSLRHIIGTNLIFFFLIALLFTRFLYLPLPTGNWPGFYELGTGIVQMLNAF